MKNFIKFLCQAVFSLGIGYVCAYMCIRFNFGYRFAPIAAFMCGAGLGALLSGMFAGDDARTENAEKTEGTEYESIRHRMGRRDYGHAAVFVGTACLFMGTLAECEDMADDLWHYGQQASVEMLTGEETSFEVL